MRVENYPNTASTIEDDDLFDLTVKISEGVYESMKVTGATLKALLTSGVNLATSNITQTNQSRNYNIGGATNELTFFNGLGLNFNVSNVNLSNNFQVSGVSNLSIAVLSARIRETGIQTITSNAFTDSNSTVILVNTSTESIKVNLPNLASNQVGWRIHIFDNTGKADEFPINVESHGIDSLNGVKNLFIRRKWGHLTLRAISMSKWVVEGQLDESGWGFYRDTTLGQSTSIDVPVHIQATKETAIETKLPLNVATYWDDVNFKIPAILDDNVSIQLGFNAEQLTAGDHFIDVWLDVNGEQRYKHFQTLKGHAATTSINFSISNINQDASWVTNGARLFVRSQSALVLTEFRLNVSRNFTK
jgi:hypothetical protein